MSRELAEKAAGIVRDAGGQIVGRTRLQKTAYLLSITGLEDGFRFVYKHYGPFSEELAASAADASLLHLMSEIEQQATWGGVYSIYRSTTVDATVGTDPRRRLAEEAAKANAIELELAATAAFLALDGYDDPWIETARRKPEKSDGDRIEKAKDLYRRLRLIDTPTPMPDIV